MAADATQFWWIRHAPVEKTAGYTGQTDVPALMPERPPLWTPDKDALCFVSPLQRAVQTAQWLGLEPPRLRMVPALMEQHFGAWENQPYDEVWQRAQHQYDWSRPEAIRPPGGESFADVCERVGHWLEECLARHAGTQLVVVAHAGPIRAALRHALNVEPGEVLSYDIGNCSLTHITYGADGRGGINCVNTLIAQ